MQNSAAFAILRYAESESVEYMFDGPRSDSEIFKRGRMTMYEYLRQQREDPPAWLGRFNPGDPFPREQFFASRVVYYPGSGTDGHPVKVFGSTHSAHCFVYADYGVTQTALEEELGDPRYGFRGYHRLSRLQLRETDLIPGVGPLTSIAPNSRTTDMGSPPPLRSDSSRS
jgi:hypothetical protein